MNLPFDDNIIESSFCWSEYEATVDKGPRVRLNRAIIRTFQEHNVKKLWQYLDPTGPRMIICPARNRQKFIEIAKQNFPSSMEPAEAYRKFICTGKAFQLKDHGRVSITEIFNQHMQITAGKRVVILGVGLWYEVYKLDDWMNRFNNCRYKKKL